MTAANLQTPTLADVLAYTHPGVVRRYAKEHGASQEEAAEVFQQMLKWLYLCYRSTLETADGLGCTMTPDLGKIDWMWHEFLMFTQDYAAFCEDHFGLFLHHVPTEDDDEEESRPLDLDAIRQRLEQQYALVYDVLGEATLKSWHDECRYAVEE